ncbi:hypothetical protein JL722_6800 [Aureococcus anophagefferens]|nr:hypothetical protein JL722_6800 [Aureococcus anophagefferens]
MATVTLYVSYAAPGGEAPELRVDVPATKTVRSVAKAVAKLVERKHGAAPAGLRLLYAAASSSAGRSLETALVGEVAFGAVVRVSGHVAGDGRCAVAGGDLEGFGSSKCLAPLVDENDPLCVAFEHALAEPDGPQASVWVRHGARRPARTPSSPRRGPRGPPRGRGSRTDPRAAARLAPVYVESGGPADDGGPPTCHWDVALRLAADVAAGARRRRRAPLRRSRGGGARLGGGGHRLHGGHPPVPVPQGPRAAPRAPRRGAGARRRRRWSRRRRRAGATPAFPLILGVLAVRDAQFCERLMPPNAPPPPPSAGAATDAELAEIALFAKLTRLPNLLLWPMDAADAAPGR